MEGFVVLLVMLAIGVIGAGPLAVVLVIVLFKKFGRLESRLSRLEGKPEAGAMPSTQTRAAEPVRSEPSWSGRGITFEPVSLSRAAEAPQAAQPEPQKPMAREPEAKPKYADLKQPVTETAESTKKQEPVVPPVPPKPIRQPAPAVTPAPKPAVAPAPETTLRREYAQPHHPAQPGGLELKIGTRVFLVVGIILVIFAVGFFLKVVYKHLYIPPWGRVALVAAGGVVAIVIGDFLRRRNFEIVAKGIAALGFALLYAAVFGAHGYRLCREELIFVFAIIVAALSMGYAVVLNTTLIAFLSLLGGYLVPLIILKGQNLPIPLFSYLLALSAGAMGCAMFRRWRAVNWIAMVGTWLLYTMWFKKFYTSEQMTVALFWLTVFGCLYLVLPVLNGLVRRIEARVEDVVLVVTNSVVVLYFLYQILSPYDQKKLALATALLGTAHLAVMAAALWRCRSDVKLQSSLGVLGVAFITAALPMYFEFQAALVGWTIEAAALTYVGVRYRGLWTQVMGFLVAGAAVVGLFYHLPLHREEDFHVFFNAPFGTWLLVAAGLLTCHLCWRFMKQAQEQKASFAAQVFYTAGILLATVAVGLEWYAHCNRHMLYDPVGQAHFLKGMMITAIMLVPALLARPLRPRGELVQTAGVTMAVFGAVFVAIAMMGVYHEAFKLFINVPFALALVFLGMLFWAAWHCRRSHESYELQHQLPGALIFLGLLYFFVILTEQMYLYWSCQHEYADFEGRWEYAALRYSLIAWAAYGLVLLAGGIHFKRKFVQASAFVVTLLSAVGVFFLLPLHRSDEFKFVYNASFMTWVIVAIAILVGHGLWRFLSKPEEKDNLWAAQFYYAAGLFLLAVGAGFEWAEHCRWHLESDSALSHLHLGLIVLTAVTVMAFLGRPLAPAGGLVMTAGVLTALGGAVYTAFAMTEVYYSTFALFFNWPFAIAMLFAAVMLSGAWFIRRWSDLKERAGVLPTAIVLSGLVLIWVLLSEQVYSYWHCKGVYGSQEIANWRFSAQMYMSVTWAIYAAILMVIGFGVRKASIRWLSLFIFAVLLVKIVLDMFTIRIEYGYIAVLIVGLIFVGVAFLYKFLHNRGFFDAIGKQLSIDRSEGA